MLKSHTYIKKMKTALNSKKESIPNQEIVFAALDNLESALTNLETIINLQSIEDSSAGREFKKQFKDVFNI